MTITLHNTQSRSREEFKPIDAKNISMYVCGPTVYDHAHIGNARPPVVFDLLYRLLRHTYGDAQVTYARNFTDIDDKIMAKADEEGTSIEVISERYIKIYKQDMLALNNLTPDIEPKATDHLPEMLNMMQALAAKGFAYEKMGHVLFHTTAMEGYGSLSKHEKDELEAGARVEVAPYKKDATDFVLWKPSTSDQPGWDSQWGRGRPGWHLECSAMIEKHLGETIDIHGGGQDLIFPHHENEIAQSQCAHDAPLANYWLHNGYLNMKGEKMSKSVGNIRSISSLLAEFPGEALRLTLLSASYRGPLDFNIDIVREQKKRLDRWYRIVDGVEAASDVPQSIINALSDDLNTPKALAELEMLAYPEGAAELKAGAQFMGLLLEDAQAWFKGASTATGLSDADIEALIVERADAKANNDYARSDATRDKLKEAGVLLEDNPSGTTWRRD